jgi:septal ring factor EnvC (AmiA/AmiB activator)
MSRTHDVTISAFDLDQLEREVINWKTAHDIAIEQRDRAQSKIENQAERIKYLEGATNHAGGTPLRKMKEQRDMLAEVAQAVWDRWETPLWKDHPPTALVMNKLRDALEAVKGGDS